MMRVKMGLIKSNISITGSMSTLTQEKLHSSARFQVGQLNKLHKIGLAQTFFFQIVTRSSRQSSS